MYLGLVSKLNSIAVQVSKFNGIYIWYIYVQYSVV